MALVVYQDFKDRQVYLVVFPVLALGFGYMQWSNLGWEVLLQNSLINLLFVGIEIGGLVLYLTIKKRELVNIFKGHMGLGDLLFFIVLAFAFAPVNFIAFMVASICITLVGYLVALRKDATIPLAGGMAAVLSFILLIGLIQSDLSLLFNQHMIAQHLMIF